MRSAAQISPPGLPRRSRISPRAGRSPDQPNHLGEKRVVIVDVEAPDAQIAEAPDAAHRNDARRQHVREGGGEARGADRAWPSALFGFPQTLPANISFLARRTRSRRRIRGEETRAARAAGCVRSGPRSGRTTRHGTRSSRREPRAVR